MIKTLKNNLNKFNKFNLIQKIFLILIIIIFYLFIKRLIFKDKTIEQYNNLDNLDNSLYKKFF